MQVPPDGKLSEVIGRVQDQITDQEKAIVDYLNACKTIPEYQDYKIGWNNEDFMNNKVTVRVYYTSHYTDRKF